MAAMVGNRRRPTRIDLPRGQVLRYTRLMGVTDVMLLVIRWLHAMAAVAWVGGGIFYLLVLRPALGGRNGEPAEATLRVGEQFRHLVNTAIAVLLVTGAVLTLSRLTSDYVGIPYIAVLSAKIALAVYMFYLVRFLRPEPTWSSPGRPPVPWRGSPSSLLGPWPCWCWGSLLFSCLTFCDPWWSTSWRAEGP